MLSKIDERFSKGDSRREILKLHDFEFPFFLICHIFAHDCLSCYSEVLGMFWNPSSHAIRPSPEEALQQFQCTTFRWFCFSRQNLWDSLAIINSSLHDLSTGQLAEAQRLDQEARGKRY